MNLDIIVEFASYKIECKKVKRALVAHVVNHADDAKSLSLIDRLILSYRDRLGLLSWNIAWRKIAGLVSLNMSGKTTSIIPTAE